MLQLVLADGEAGVLLGHFQPHFALAYGFGNKLHLFAVLGNQRFLQAFGQAEVADDDVGLAFAEVMLRHKGFGVFLRLRVGIVAHIGEEAFVAHMPPAAYAHPMDAHGAAFECQRENVDIVGVVGVFAVDKLLALHQAQRLDLVAVAGGFFKLQRGGGLVHFMVQRLRELARFAVEKGYGFADAGLVIFMADVADAGAGAAADLIKQAGALAVGKHAVFAGAQAEHFLQNLDAVAHGIAVGIRAEILVGLFERAAVIGHLRVFVGGKHQIGVAFVVAEKNIVFGRQGFDEIVFQNQRFGFAAGNGGFNRMHLPHHQRDAWGMVAFLEIAAHAPLQIHRLAHIKHLAAFIEHAVNARQIGQVFQENIDIEILAHGSGCKKVSDGLNDTAIGKGRLKGVVRCLTQHAALVYLFHGMFDE